MRFQKSDNFGVNIFCNTCVYCFHNLFEHSVVDHAFVTSSSLVCNIYRWLIILHQPRKQFFHEIKKKLSESFCHLICSSAEYFQLRMHSQFWVDNGGMEVNKSFAKWEWTKYKIQRKYISFNFASLRLLLHLTTPLNQNIIWLHWDDKKSILSRRITTKTFLPVFIFFFSSSFLSIQVSHDFDLLKL